MTVRLALLLALTTAACGSSSNYYRSAASDEEKCCNQLSDGEARRACLGDIPRLEDTVANSSTNQKTFECVASHFRCDGKTGRATPESAQAQLDCLNDLPAE